MRNKYYARCAIAGVAALLPAKPLAGWPPITCYRVEHAVLRADSAFAATLEFFDVDKTNANILDVSGRIRPTLAVWGQLPGGPIELGRASFLLHGGSGGGFGPWETVVLGQRKLGQQMPILVLTSDRDSGIEILYVVPPEGEKPPPPGDHLMMIRQFESEADSQNLRERLAGVARAPESSELQWSYALRRLCRLEEDPERRFDHVLDPRLQRSSSQPMRLSYAIALLTGVEYVDPTSPRKIPPDEMRTVLVKLLEALEAGESTDMAVLALGNFVNQPVGEYAVFTDQEWDDVRQRIRNVVDNPDHPIHKARDVSRESANRVLDRLFGEPNLLSTEKHPLNPE